MSKQTSKRLFQADDGSSTILRAWWEGLERDRGGRATLKRASSPTEAVFCPAYHRLLSELQNNGYSPKREALASVAGLAAHVKFDTGLDKSLAQQFANPKPGGNGAKVSGLRFRRILAITERNELYPLLIRVIHLLDQKVNLLSLANAVYWWNEKTLKDLAYDYYATAPDEK